MAGKYKKRFQAPISFGDIMDIIGCVFAGVVICLFFVVLPLYFKDGYNNIATNKYLYMMSAGKLVAVSATVLLFVRMFLWGYTKEELAKYKSLRYTDICVLALALFSFASYFFSEFRSEGVVYDNMPSWFVEGPFWGTKGWYMGLVSYLLFILLYFIISRALIYNRVVFIPVLATSAVICLWGVLNRYNISPINMNYDYKKGSFLASLGNINWFAGYTSIICPLGWGLYVGTKKLWFKIILFIVNTLSFYMIFVNQSDSGVFCTVVVFAVLLGYSIYSYERILSFVELMFSMLIPSVLIGAFEAAGIKRNGGAGIIDRFHGKFSIIVLVFVIAIYIAILLIKNKVRLPFKVIRKAYCIGVAALVAGFIGFIIINTATKGALVPLKGEKSMVYFNGRWGSSRGYTWTYGLRTFGEMNFGGKLFGCGPDSFYFELKNHEAIFNDCNEVFKGARLTNAHNELITLLVNIGLLGTAAFIGAIVTGIRNSFRSAKQSPEYIAFGLALISYTANNFFSFQQVTNTPFLFMVLGLEGAAIAKLHESSVSLTKTPTGNTIHKGKKRARR